MFAVYQRARDEGSHRNGGMISTEWKLSLRGAADGSLQKGQVPVFVDQPEWARSAFHRLPEVVGVAEGYQLDRGATAHFLSLREKTPTTKAFARQKGYCKRDGRTLLKGKKESSIPLVFAAHDKFAQRWDGRTPAEMSAKRKKRPSFFFCSHLKQPQRRNGRMPASRRGTG